MLKEKQIEVLNKMLEESGEPIVNVLLFAVSELEGKLEEVRVREPYRALHDERVIAAMNKAIDELEKEMYTRGYQED